MSRNTELDKSYAKWERYANKVSWADMEDEDKPKPGQPKHLGQINPKDLTVSFGKPLTEEEFRALQRSKSVGSTKK